MSTKEQMEYLVKLQEEKMLKEEEKQENADKPKVDKEAKDEPK